MGLYSNTQNTRMTLIENALIVAYTMENGARSTLSKDMTCFIEPTLIMTCRRYHRTAIQMNDKWETWCLWTLIHWIPLKRESKKAKKKKGTNYITSSKTGTLPPTRPVFPPWGTTARRLELQYLRTSETCITNANSQ